MLTGENFRGKPVDIWACGVTLYMFVYGHPPFEAKTMTELYGRIQVWCRYARMYCFLSDSTERLSTRGVRMIRSCILSKSATALSRRS